MIYAMIFSGASAFAMSYASAWCVRSTSSTTYSMVGALNKLPIAASGILFFGDPATFANVTAIIIGKGLVETCSSKVHISRVNLCYLGFIAGLVYSYAKTTGSKPNPSQPQSIPMSSSSQSAADAAKANG